MKKETEECEVPNEEQSEGVEALTDEQLERVAGGITDGYADVGNLDVNGNFGILNINANNHLRGRD